MSHGNYRRLHYSEALKEAVGNDEMLVTSDEVLWTGPGKGRGVTAVHVVTEPDYWTHDEPKAYIVELVRPMWAYGNEGHLNPIRFVCHVDELTADELDAMTEADPYWDLIPDGSWLWAVPKGNWERCEIPWWNAFRDAPAVGEENSQP